jgi:hypothetical protein
VLLPANLTTKKTATAAAMTAGTTNFRSTIGERIFSSTISVSISQ